jgi:hypothetical protein
MSVNATMHCTTASTVGAETSIQCKPAFYSVAINGDSAALSPIPLPLTVRCSPTPQLLIGLKTLVEAMTLRSCLVKAPMNVARKEIKAMRRSPEAICIEPAKPEPPPRGGTSWSAD